MKNFYHQYSKLLRSLAFQRDSYTRRITGFLILPLWFVFMFLAYLVKQYIWSSDHVYLMAFFLALILAILIAEKKAEKKFKDKYGES